MSIILGLNCNHADSSACIIKNGEYDTMNNYFNDTRTGDIGVYARINIPLGKRAKNRIDCNRLYDLELRKKQLEVQRLEAELRQLRELKFEE